MVPAVRMFVARRSSTVAATTLRTQAMTDIFCSYASYLLRGNLLGIMARVIRNFHSLSDFQSVSDELFVGSVGRVFTTFGNRAPSIFGSMLVQYPRLGRISLRSLCIQIGSFIAAVAWGAASTSSVVYYTIAS